jgi:hypothetical protein
MLDKLIDEYTAILDKDPMDQAQSTDKILQEFADKVIELSRQNLGQSNYYKKQHSLWID